MALDITAEAAHDITAEAPEGQLRMHRRCCTRGLLGGAVRTSARSGPSKKLRVFLGWSCLIFWQVCESSMRATRACAPRAHVGGRGLCVRGQGEADRVRVSRARDAGCFGRTL
jgi:hypothetical protein